MIRDAIDPDLPLGLGEIPYSSGQIMHLQADLTTLRQDTGFVPQVSFEEGIRRTVAVRRAKMSQGGNNIAWQSINRS